MKGWPSADSWMQAVVFHYIERCYHRKNLLYYNDKVISFSSAVYNDVGVKKYWASSIHGLPCISYSCNHDNII